VDFSAAAALREVCAELKERQIRLVFSDANDHVRHELDVSGVTDLINQDAYYLDLRSVLEAYQLKTGIDEAR
jgi:MFS superfamily sulfate permease-like transporter